MKRTMRTRKASKLNRADYDITFVSVTLILIATYHVFFKFNFNKNSIICKKEYRKMVEANPV